TGSPLRKRPTRRRGPCRSMTMEQGIRAFSEVLRISLTISVSSFIDECEQLRRKALAPACRSLAIISGRMDAGPSVARILVIFGRSSGACPSVRPFRGIMLCWLLGKDLLEGPPVGGPDDAALGDDGGHELVRRDVESEMMRPSAFGRDVLVEDA